MLSHKTKQHLKRTFPARQARQVYCNFKEFARLEASGGIMLLAAAAIALIWANSPWAAAYFDLWHTELGIQIGPFSLVHDLHWWINDGLMVIFFFVVGLEIKRELLVGELSNVRQALLPIAAAIGGMALPALIYVAFNWGTPGIAGWGAPMATDIAFSLGVMALLGRRAPLGLKVFLTALAVVDDLGAVLVIAFFYSGAIQTFYLFAALGVLVLLLGANIMGTRSPLVYALLGILLWLLFLQSGVHATLAGVLLALTIPAEGKIRVRRFVERARAHLDALRPDPTGPPRMVIGEQQEILQALETAVEQVQTPLQRLEHALHPWVTYAIMPIFALANAGVSLGGGALGEIFTNRVSLGVLLGLIVGKQIGVTGGAWLAVRAHWADLPEGIGWRGIYGVSWLAAIGFTMSLFVAGLAFGQGPELEVAKLGILAASLLAGGVGYAILRRRPESAPEEALARPRVSLTKPEAGD
jgi:NhaA family Na+:H+ antiporter